MKLAKYIENKTITVEELKEMLEEFPNDMPVMFAYNYGDHGRTQVAQGFTEVEAELVEYSDYHRMPKLHWESVDDIDDEDEDDETTKKVLILR